MAPGARTAWPPAQRLPHAACAWPIRRVPAPLCCCQWSYMQASALQRPNRCQRVQPVALPAPSIRIPREGAYFTVRPPAPHHPVPQPPLDQTCASAACQARWAGAWAAPPPAPALRQQQAHRGAHRLLLLTLLLPTGQAGYLAACKASRLSCKVYRQGGGRRRRQLANLL